MLSLTSMWWSAILHEMPKWCTLDLSTDTPDKKSIEAEKADRALKKSKTVCKSASKTLSYSSESETEDIDNLCEESCLSEEDLAELEDPDNRPIDIGSFVLVKFAGKKTIKYFVAEVMSLNDTTYEVKYLKKDLNSQKFTRQDSTTYVVDKSDVMWKLPHPVLTGGSERQLQKLTFGIDLSNYNVG